MPPRPRAQQESKKKLDLQKDGKDIQPCNKKKGLQKKHTGLLEGILGGDGVGRRCLGDGRISGEFSAVC